MKIEYNGISLKIDYEWSEEEPEVGLNENFELLEVCLKGVDILPLLSEDAKNDIVKQLKGEIKEAYETRNI